MTDDRQTTDRQTDGRRHIANMNMSSRSLKTNHTHEVISEYTVTYSRPTFKTIGRKRIFKYLGPRAQGTYLVVANAVPPPTEHNRAALNSSAGFERPLASQQEKRERKTEEGKERDERKGIRQGENIPNKLERHTTGRKHPK